LNVICLKFLNQEYIIQLLLDCNNLCVFPDLFLYVEKYMIEFLIHCLDWWLSGIEFRYRP